MEGFKAYCGYEPQHMKRKHGPTRKATLNDMSQELSIVTVPVK